MWHANITVLGCFVQCGFFFLAWNRYLNMAPGAFFGSMLHKSPLIRWDDRFNWAALLQSWRFRQSPSILIFLPRMGTGTLFLWTFCGWLPQSLLVRWNGCILLTVLLMRVDRCIATESLLCHSNIYINDLDQRVGAYHICRWHQSRFKRILTDWWTRPKTPQHQFWQEIKKWSSVLSRKKSIAQVKAGWYLVALCMKRI